MLSAQGMCVHMKLVVRLHQSIAYGAHQAGDDLPCYRADSNHSVLPVVGRSRIITQIGKTRRKPAVREVCVRQNLFKLCERVCLHFLNGLRYQRVNEQSYSCNTRQQSNKH